MTQLDGDEHFAQYEFRFYFNQGKLMKAIVKRKSGDEKEFQQVYAGATLKAAYQGDYDQLVKAAHAVRKLFTDIEKEAY